MSRKHQKGELIPFREPGYVSMNGELAPFAYLDWPYCGDSIVLAFFSENNAFSLRAWKGDRGPIPKEVRDALVHHVAFQVDPDGNIYRQVERELIEAALDELVSAARSVPQPTTTTGAPDAASPGSSHV